MKILNANPTVRQIDLGPDYAELPDEEEETVRRPQRPPKNLKTPLSASPIESREAERSAGAIRKDKRVDAAPGVEQAVKEEPSVPEPAEQVSPDAQAQDSSPPPSAPKRKRRVLVFGDPTRR